MNNIKIILLSLSLSSSISTDIQGQKLDSSSVIAVVPFKVEFDNTDDQTNYSKIFAERVLTAFEQSRRFVIVDRTDFNTVQEEIKLQNGKYKQDFYKWGTEDYSEYGRRLKADYLVTGSISTVSSNIDMIKGSYKSTISFTIKVIEVQTNKIYVTKDFEVKSSKTTSLTVHSDSKESTSAAINNMGEPVKLFVDLHFPIIARYIKTTKITKNEIKEVMINGGTDKGFRNGQSLDIVIKDTKSDVNIPLEDIGNAEIISVLPDHAVVKIKSSRKPLQAMEDKENVLFFRSKAN